MLSLLVCAQLCTAIASTPGDGIANIYKVYIQNHTDAEILSNLGVNAFMHIRDGYLIQAPPDCEEGFILHGLSYDLVAQGINRSHMALDLSRDQRNVKKYSPIYQEGNIRIYHIDPADRDDSREWQGLAPILSDNLKIVYKEPPQLDPSVTRDMLDLDSLASLILVDSCQSYTERLQAFQTRWSGTDSNLASRDWLMEKFESFGYDSVVYDTFWSNQTYGAWDLVLAHSVIAYKVGTTYPDHQIVFGAHRDSYPVESPGADDDASGCAAVLEIARILSDVDTRMTFIFALFDTEETGLFGSWNYSNRAVRNGDSIVLMINTDVIAYDENTDIVSVSNTPGSPFGQIWYDLADSLPSINLTVLMSEWAFADGLSFEMNGFNVIETFEYIFNPYMHTAHDSTVYLDFDYMTRITRASLATAHVIDNTYVPDPQLKFSFPNGTPELLSPNSPITFDVVIEPYADAVMTPGSGQLHYSINDGSYETIPLTEIGAGLFQATLPSWPCNSRIGYYISAQESAGETFVSVDIAQPHLAATGIELTTIAEYDFEEYTGWQAYGNANQGQWSRAYPHGYGHNAEVPIDYDASGRCYLTGPEPQPWNYTYTDVDDGTTILRSPAIDMTVGQILIEYARWYSNHYGSSPYSDVFEVRISDDDGQSWTLVETVGPVVQASGGWFVNRFWVNDIIIPTTQMRLRFDASDLGSDSNIEAAVDAVRIVRYTCGPAVEILTDNIPDWTRGIPLNFAMEATGGYGDVSWEDKDGDLDGTGIALASDGILSGTPTLDGEIIFTAMATDELGQVDENQFSFMINPELAVSTVSVSNGTVNAEYSFMLSSAGGTGEKNWIDLYGDLEGSGIELLYVGLLYGTPTDTGTITFTAEVADQVGAFAEKSFELRVLEPYLCGDANGDEQANVGDAVYLISHVFKSGPAPEPLESGDANCDSEVNVGDAVYLINYVFKSGPEPCCP
jgi:hypothetical protein